MEALSENSLKLKDGTGGFFRGSKTLFCSVGEIPPLHLLKDLCKSVNNILHRIHLKSHMTNSSQVSI